MGPLIFTNPEDKFSPVETLLSYFGYLVLYMCLYYIFVAKFTSLACAIVVREEVLANGVKCAALTLSFHGQTQIKPNLLI